MKRATLFLATLLLAPAIVAAVPPPAVRLKISDEFVRTGDREKVHVRSASDGYLVVLRMDTEGNMRVVFPVDPSDDGYIRGDKDVEIRGRGDREAFEVSENSGSGLVLAAVSDRPFNFDAFSRANHWDYRALAPDDRTKDPEAAMLDIVDRMTDGRYNYDLASYTVGNRVVRGPVYAGWYGPWYPSRYGVWVVGRPYHYYAPRVGIGFNIRLGGGSRSYDRGHDNRGNNDRGRDDRGHNDRGRDSRGHDNRGHR
jgi:hypothetical protein